MGEAPKAGTGTGSPGIAAKIDQNIEALMRRRREAKQQASREQRIAEAVSRFAGSMTFVYIHAAFFGLWIIINAGLIPGLPRWDPSLVVLAMFASVEAIFLSTFVLINQNLQAAADDERADLHLQIGLLNEQETTKLLTLVSAIAERLDVHSPVEQDVAELEEDVFPDDILEKLAETREAG